MGGGLLGFKAKNHPQQVDVRGVEAGVDDRGTPWDLFTSLSERFGGFTLDVAAAAHNTKCSLYYDLEVSGLEHSWQGERIWCNPPYSTPNLALFAEKAWSEWEQGGVEIIVMLVPANRCEQPWWQDNIEERRDRVGSPLRVEFLRDRRRFIRHDLGFNEVRPNDRPPFGVCLLIWSKEFV